MTARKVVLITGAAKGIGAAIAEEFSRRGHDMLLTDLDGAPLGEVARSLESAGARVNTLVGDLADMSFVDLVVPRCIETFGRIDVLVNNAAWRELATMRQITVDSFEKTLRICLTAPAFLARAAATAMERQRRGVIINVSSIMSSLASGIAPAYVAAKGGLEALTYDLAALYGPSGVRVVAVRPGAVDTAISNDYTAREDQSGFDQRLRTWSQEMIPLRRWATAQEVAKAICLLASDEASYLTGTTITVDGGWSHQFWPYGLKQEQNPDQFP